MEQKNSLENNTKIKSKIPPALYVIIPVCIYFMYNSYNRFMHSDYFSSAFFLAVAIALLVASYVVFKQHKDSLK